MSQPPFVMSKYGSELDLLRDKCAWQERELAEAQERDRHHAACTAKEAVTLVRAGIPAFGYVHEGIEMLAAKLRERDAYAVNLEKAVEFGGYLAKSAKDLLDACNAFHKAQDEAEDEDAGDAAHEALEAAREAFSETYSGVRNDIYEFEKRRDRALLAKNPNPSGPSRPEKPSDGNEASGHLSPEASGPVGLGPFKNAWEEFQGDFYRAADLDQQHGGAYIITETAWSKLLWKVNTVIGTQMEVHSAYSNPEVKS